MFKWLKRTDLILCLALSLILLPAAGNIPHTMAEPPSYFLGDVVKLETTITNTGDVSIASSSFTVNVISPLGAKYFTGSVTGGSVPPKQDIMIKTEWSSVGAVPGTFSLELDGLIKFTNGAEQPVHSVSEGAFILVETMTGNRQVYTPGNDFNFINVIPAQESYYVGGPIVIGAHVDNIGHIQTSMSFQLVLISPEGDRYECPIVDFPDDLCDPGQSYFNYVSSVPPDVPPGEYSCEFIGRSFGWSPPSDMVYGDYGWESFYLDYYVLPPLEGLEGQYDWAGYLVDQGLLPNTDIIQADRWYRWHQGIDNGALPGPPQEYNNEWFAGIEQDVSTTRRLYNFSTQVHEIQFSWEFISVEVVDDEIPQGGTLNLRVHGENTGNTLIYINFHALLEGQGESFDLLDNEAPLGWLVTTNPFDQEMSFDLPEGMNAGEYLLSLRGECYNPFPNDLLGKLTDDFEVSGPYILALNSLMSEETAKDVLKDPEALERAHWTDTGALTALPLDLLFPSTPEDAWTDEWAPVFEVFSGAYSDLLEEGALESLTVDWDYTGKIKVVSSETPGGGGSTGIPAYPVEAMIAGILAATFVYGLISVRRGRSLSLSG